LTDFPGTIVFISHDPTFLTRVATLVVEVDDGQAKNYFGDYEYFLWKKAQEFESIKESSAELSAAKSGKSAAPTKAMASQVQPKVDGGERRDLTKTQARLEKQVSRAEAEIATMETKVKAREQELTDPALYQEFSRWGDLQREQEGWKKELERLTARWESLSEELQEVREKLTAAG
jgi:ATP-binding cassette subfamily F protein 3